MISRRTLLSSGSAGLAALAAGPVLSAETEPPTPSAALKATFDDIFMTNLKASPTRATSLGLDKGELAGMRFMLEDASEAADLAAQDRTRTALEKLAKLDRNPLTGMDRINYDAVSWSLKVRKLGQDQFHFGGRGGARPYVISQLTGAYQSVPDFMSSQHRVDTKDDAEAFLARLDAFAVLLDQETERFIIDTKSGVIPPDFVISRSLEQMNAAFAVKGADSPVTKAILSKTTAKGIDGDWANEAAKRLDGPVRAAMARQIEALKTILPKAGHEAGVWRLNDGEAYYQYAVLNGTTTNMTGEDIHKLGLEKVAEIGAQIDTQLKRIGLTQGHYGARMASLYKDPKQLYDNTDAAKETLIADLNAHLVKVYARLPEVFSHIPKAKVEIRRVPKAIEAGAPGGYYNGASLDGTRPGAYYINLRNTAEVPRFVLKTLTHHEAVPGHHFQISTQLESGSLPLIRKTSGYPAYSEGWALYAEQLADEMGMYEDDPLGRLGYLHDAMFRAVRLVVDSGMHYKHWSREQAIDYMVLHTADTVSGATTEIERYCVWPGQALAYMTGKIQWLKLREAMRAKQGAAFDIKRFHDVGLQAGGIPLSLLEQVYRENGLI